MTTCLLTAQRAIKELQSPVTKAVWLNGPLLVRVMVHRLLTALDSRNESYGSELSTELPETDHAVLVIDFTSGEVRMIDGTYCCLQTYLTTHHQPFDKAHKLDCGTPEKDE